jgi:hypothetical protein
MKVVAFRVQLKQMAVSYPGVGRFRRAETGILGRAIKGVPLGLPFLFGTSTTAKWETKIAGETLLTCNGNALQLSRAGTACRAPTEQHGGNMVLNHYSAVHNGVLHSSQAISTWSSTPRISAIVGNLWRLMVHCAKSSP